MDCDFLSEEVSPGHDEEGTLSSLASSSSKAMFSASLTAKDFTMAGLEVERDLLPPLNDN